MLASDEIHGAAAGEHRIQKPGERRLRWNDLLGAVMRVRKVEQREGERLGDIDWTYDFASHGWTSHGGGHNPELIPKEVERLRQVEEAFKAGKSVKVRLHGECLEPVVDVGMYDGWPYWRPVPSVCSTTWLGASWHDFSCISAVVIE